MNIYNLLEINKNDKKIILFIKSVIKSIAEHNIMQIGGQLAYFFILSFSPFVIFLNALVGFSNIESGVVMASLMPFLPYEIVEIIENYIDHVTVYQSVSLLSAGLLISVYSSSKAVMSLIFAINNAYGIKKRRGFLKSTLLSVMFTFGIGITILVTIVLITISSTFIFKIAGHFNVLIKLNVWFDISRWVVVIITLFFVIALLYFVTPNKKVKFKNVIWGTIFSVTGWIVLTLAFSFYLNNFTNYSLLYGSLGALFILMIWMYLVGVVLLIGAEINSILERIT